MVFLFRREFILLCLLPCFSPASAFVWTFICFGLHHVLWSRLLPCFPPASAFVWTFICGDCDVCAYVCRAFCRRPPPCGLLLCTAWSVSISLMPCSVPAPAFVWACWLCTHSPGDCFPPAVSAVWSLFRTLHWSASGWHGALVGKMVVRSRRQAFVRFAPPADSCRGLPGWAPVVVRYTDKPGWACAAPGAALRFVRFAVS